MMTARSEYRLLHRQDNADERLMGIGRRIGLVSEERYAKTVEKYRAVERERQRLEKTHLPPTEELNALLSALGTAPLVSGASLADLLRRPQVGYADLAPFDTHRPELPHAVWEQAEITIKYEGYIRRALKQVEDFRRMESRKLPPEMDYLSIPGLRMEARQKLQDIRPENFGQAGRISGVSPADLAALMIWMEGRK